jgi:hypothetical protein
MPNDNIDPMYEYVDSKYNDLAKEILSIKRDLAKTMVTSFTGTFVLYLREENPNRHNSVKDKISKNMNFTVKEISNSDNPIQLANIYITQLSNLVFPHG